MAGAVTISFDARLVAAAAGVPQAEAERRVDQLATDAKLAAEKARKFGIVAAFIFAATMMVSALAAWWSAHGPAGTATKDPCYRSSIAGRDFARIAPGPNSTG